MKNYILKNIYDLISYSFNDTDLQSFCLFNFAEVYNTWSDTQSKQQKIMTLLNYCEKKMIFDKLLNLMEQENETRYKYHKPYIEINNYNNLSEEKFITNIPPKPAFFVGRIAKMQEIAELLYSGETLLIINGVGGIGKSTVVLQFAHSQEFTDRFQNIAWFNVTTNLLQDFINTFAKPEEIALTQIPDLKKQALILIKYLKTKFLGETLLIIDNANNTEELQNCMELLQKLDWNIIITSRTVPENYVTVNLNELSEDEAKKLFLKHYLFNQKQEAKIFENLPELTHLLKHINYHTLMIELLAKSGNKRPLSIPQLYQIINNADIKHPDLQKKISAGLHAELSIKEKNIVLHQYIMEMFEPEKLNNNEQQFLKQFSLLPTEEIPEEHIFKMFVPNEKQTEVEFINTILENANSGKLQNITTDQITNAKNILNKIEKENKIIFSEFENTLEKLYQNGWLIQNKIILPRDVELTYRIHNLVQEVIIDKLKPDPENCIALIENVKKILQKEKLNNARGYTVYAHSIVTRLYQNIPSQIKNSQTADFELGLLCIQLSDTYSMLGQLLPALTIIEKGEKIFEAINEKDNMSVCTQNIANLQLELGKTTEAIKNYEKFIAIRKELVSTNPDNKRYKNGLAIAYEKYGDFYHILGRTEQTLENYIQSYNISRDLFINNPNSQELKKNLAISHSKLGEIYGSIGNTEMQLENYTQTNKLFADLYLQNPNDEKLKHGLAIAHEKLGNAYFNIDDMTQSLDNYLKTNTLFKELYNENSQNENFKSGLAISFSKLGEIYDATDKTTEALENYVESNRLFYEMHQNNKDNENIARGLAISHEKIGDMYRDQQKMQLAYDNYLKNNLIFEQLHKNNPQNESLKSGLAISYQKIALTFLYQNIAKATEYFIIAFNIANQLFVNNPKNIDIKSNYAELNAIIVCTKLIENSNIDKTADLQKSKNIWNEILQLSDSKIYKEKLLLIDKIETSKENYIDIILNISK